MFPPKRPAGFTLIEMLVSIGLVSVMVGFTLSAVLQSRSSGRKLVCLNNLNQIGVALNLFESSNQAYPGVFYGFASKFNNSPNYSRLVSFSPASRLAAFLGEPSLSPSIQDGSGVSTSDADWLSTQIPSPGILRCPEDSNLIGMATSYRFNRGVLPLWPEDPRGVFIRADQGFRPADIRDGLSVTAFVSERLVTLAEPGRISPSTTVIQVAAQGNQMAEQCWDANNRGVGRSTSLYPEGVGQSWLSGRWIHASYYHFLSPNSAWYDCAGGGSSILSLISARSYHDGGVNVLYGDGSVRFRTSEVALPVWRAEGTRSSGDSYSE